MTKKKVIELLDSWYKHDGHTERVADEILALFAVCYDKNLEQPKDRGCCPECGEGYDNEKEWLYNTECAVCGYPIPEHLIVKRP